MKIAIASGKGGTGKTTVATNLAFVAAQQGRSVAYMDCDVEEPNGHLYLRPNISDRRTISRPVAAVDPERCNACGRCETVCQFSAIVRIVDKVLTYPHLCHGCGACVLACPRQAISERSEPLGVIEIDPTGRPMFAQGILNVGQARAAELIRALKQAAPPADLTLLDAPPGTTCPVVQTLRDVNKVLLVAEPTPFGFHDFRLMLQTARAMAIPTAAVINRCDWGGPDLREFCHDSAVPVLAEIPEDPAIARAEADGTPASQQIPKYQALFARILNDLTGCAAPALAVEGAVA